VRISVEESGRTPRFLSDFSSVHPTGQKSKKCPQVEGHMVHLSGLRGALIEIGPLTWRLSRRAGSSWEEASPQRGRPPARLGRVRLRTRGLEDSRANPERLPLNFEGAPSGASANLRRLPRGRALVRPGSKCPAHEREPNKRTPQGPLGSPRYGWPSRAVEQSWRRLHDLSPPPSAGNTAHLRSPRPLGSPRYGWPSRAGAGFGTRLRQSRLGRTALPGFAGHSSRLGAPRTAALPRCPARRAPRG
jgi:hypothetical protein